MRKLTHIATRVFGTPLMIHPQKMEVILSVFRKSLDMSWDDMEDDDEEETDTPYASQDGVAVIPVHGPLVKRTNGMSAMCGMRSYESLRADIEAAMNDAAVKGVVLDIDSPGGEVAGLFEFTDFLMEAKKQKPVYCVANDSAYSAAYAIACCGDRLFMTQSGGVGSIGAYILHVDESQADKLEGYKYTYIHAGAKKVDGNPHEPLSKSAKDEMQAEVDKIRQRFAELVASNRSVPVQAILDTEAGCFDPDTAIPMLADNVGTLADAVERMRVRTQAEAAVPAPTAMETLAVAMRGYSQTDFNGNTTPGGCTTRSHHTKATVGENRKISLLVVPYGALSDDLGGFREVYEPGCFRGGLGNDPRVFFDHKTSMVLGRQSAGTARFWEDSEGVHVECDAPETQWASDLIVSMLRGDITQASAEFWILKHRMEYRGGTKVRVVEKALMRAASVVSIPAYETTQAIVQPAAQVSAQHELEDLDLRIRVARLR